MFSMFSRTEAPQKGCPHRPTECRTAVLHFLAFGSLFMNVKACFHYRCALKG